MECGRAWTADYGAWLGRLRSLGAEFPAWQEFFAGAPPGAYESLAAAMSGVSIVAPQPEDVFRPFGDLPPERVRFVFLGLDPYPMEGHACGRAFALREGTRGTPPSLRNLGRALGFVRRDLQDLVDGGVLLVNASPVLWGGSKKKGQPWSDFTRGLLNYLSRRGAVVVLLGKEAQAYACALPEGARVVEAPHPAARDGSFVEARLCERLLEHGWALGAPPHKNGGSQQ